MQAPDDVDGQVRLTDVENTQKIILIIVPGKYNVVNPRPENTGCDADHRKIEVLLRFCPVRFGSLLAIQIAIIIPVTITMP